MKKLIQVHICQPKIFKKKISLDAHGLPSYKLYNDLFEIFAYYKKPEYLTIEYYRNSKKLVRSILELKRKIRKYNEK